ncbi:hypothetical protein ACFSSA_08790 [Luteolibacter algae]|uniref:ParB/Sulfiredoxin domain-containing protein n=1 Tax=Luteolibacter algae TaxID=454151 RepID=A0ABW5D9Z3_9BACT
MWLEPKAEVHGWPFATNDEETKGTRWEDFFGSKKMIEVAKLQWSIDCVELDQVINQNVNRCLAFNTGTTTAGVEAPPSSRDRFESIITFLEKHGAIPAPLVCYAGEPPALMDGYHRVAALLYLGYPRSHKVPMWIGR